MTRHIPDAAFWALAACTLLAVVFAVRERQIRRALRKRVAALQDSSDARDEELAHLATARLPALAESLPVPGIRNERLATQGFGQSLQAVLGQFEEAVNRTRTRSDESARASLMATMRALQGLANEQQAAISTMQDRHDNGKVLQDLLEIDHMNSQFGRRAQVVAVLCGAWPGRQRAASALDDVVRGATSRIRDYLRVEAHGHADIAVVDRAVEPVVLAVAELLDNAARHSPPHTMVQVNIQRTHNGAVIVIDDGGVGMHDEELRQATQMLSGQQELDITRLSDPPQFGLPVVGLLATRYGFRVSVDSQSPYGGVRAVVFMPSTLLTTAPDDTPVMLTPPQMPDSGEVRPTPGGLPRRRRQQPGEEPRPAPRPYPAPMSHATEAEPALPGNPPSDTRRRAAREAAALMAALQRGTRSGRAANHATDEPQPAAEPAPQQAQTPQGTPNAAGPPRPTPAPQPPAPQAHPAAPPHPHTAPAPAPTAHPRHAAQPQPTQPAQPNQPGPSNGMIRPGQPTPSPLLPEPSDSPADWPRSGTGHIPPS